MMKKTKILSLTSLLLVLVCALMAFTFTACGSKVKITLSQTEITVAEGGKANIVATVAGSTEELTWEIDNNEVAEFNTIGKMCIVTAKKLGTAKITASIGKAHAECKVTVTADTTEKVTITLDGAEVTEAVNITSGESKTFAATASNGSAITWKTSNDKIATVDQTGKVTAVNNGTATISAEVTASIKAEITVTVTGGKDYADLESSGESGAVQNKNTWTYWCDTWVIVEEAYSLGDDVTIKFSNNDSDTPSHFYATQMFYCNSSLKSGTQYKLTFEAETTAGGRITLNGNVINLKEGKHSYTTYYTEGNTSISIQFGVNGIGMEIKEATVTLSNVKWEEAGAVEKLEAPSFTYDAETGIITITDTNEEGSVKGFTLYFYDDADKVVGNTAVTNGEKVDLGTIPNGTYTAKLVAVGANIHYQNSDPSANGVSITVANDTTKITNGEEHDAYVNPGAWYEWHDQGWNGSTVTLSKAEIDSGSTVHFGFDISGSNQQKQAAHLYKHYADLTPEKIYTLTMKLNSSVACTISICGVETTLTEGDNNIDVTFVHPSEGADWQGKSNGATIRIYFNDSGVFTLSNIEINETEQTNLTAPSFTYDADTNKITITDTNAAGSCTYVLGFFESEATAPVSTVAVTDGGEVPVPAIKNGTYTIKLMAKARDAKYIDSDWSTDTAEFTVASDKTNINYGAQADLTTGWCYWNDGGVTVSECYMDGEGSIHLTYTGSGPWYGMQLFFKDALAGQPHKLTLKINATAAGSVTVNGKVVELVAGDNDITVESFGGASVDMQFGTNGGTMINGGTFVLSDISVTAVA